MKALEQRNQTNTKKPNFERAQSGIKPQLGGKWRKGRGLHNKIRLAKRGKRISPALGWGSPKSVKGLEKDGTRGVLVASFHELLNVKEGEGVILSAKLGLRKKLELIKKGIERKLTFITIKDPQKFVEESQKALEDKKKASKKKQEEKKKKAAEVSKKAEDKKKAEEKKDKKKEAKKTEEFKEIKEEEKPSPKEVAIDEAVKGSATGDNK